MKKLLLRSWLLVLVCLAVVSCSSDDENEGKVYKSDLTKSFISMMEKDPALKSMMVKSIEKAKAINPSLDTNPGQSLEQYYDFIEWSATCMPWDVIKQPAGRTIYNRLDQGLCYAYFVFDQPLDELKDKGYYYPSLQYHEPIRTWLINYAKAWGLYLSTLESWNDDYYKAVCECPNFNMDKGWYESPDKWHSFNDFFHRYLVSPDKRPIDSPDDASVVVLPGDSKPQGVWQIDDNSQVVQKEGVVIKSSRIVSVRELVGENSAYKDAFAGGTLFHTFLNVDDYHRYHFPVSGTIKEIEVIASDDAAGGITVWDEKSGNYILECEVPGWQMFETRGRIILDTGEYGLVSIQPIGMSQVSSVNFESSLKPGMKVEKGDPMGWFDMGGSDIVLLFQKGIGVELLAEKETANTYKHGLMGNAVCKLSK